MTPTRFAGLALVVLAMACGDTVGTEPREMSDFETAHQRWQAQDLHTYAFTLQRACFCANVHPLYVFVVNDSVNGVFDLETGKWVDPKLGETVEDLFTFIQHASDDHVRLIRVEYDGIQGFPTQIDYDGAAQIADDEVSYRITNVHPVTPQIP
jgi:hypothetical protein